MWSRRVPDEPFEACAMPTADELAYARDFAVEPEMYVVQISQNMYACRQKGSTTDPLPITREMALEALELWQTGPSTYNDAQLMLTVRFVTPDAAFPDSRCNSAFHL